MAARLAGLQARSERNATHARNANPAHFAIASVVDREIYAYLDLPSLEMLSDSPNRRKVLSNPVDFWKAHKVDLPILSYAVRKYWVCPVSEAPSERIFSRVTALVNKSKVCLDPKRVSRLIFLSMNSEKFEL